MTTQVKSFLGRDWGHSPPSTQKYKWHHGNTNKPRKPKIGKGRNQLRLAKAEINTQVLTTIYVMPREAERW